MKISDARSGLKAGAAFYPPLNPTMKKLLYGTAVIAFAITGCVKMNADPPAAPINSSSILVRQCSSDDVLAKQLSEIPGFKDSRERIELFISNTVDAAPAGKILPAGSTIEIPVVVNVLYRTATENISAAQIQSQIDVLNEDFSGTNKDNSVLPPGFQPSAAGNTSIQFVLQNIVRKQTTVQTWGTNDAMKRNSTGGINASTPLSKLNFWVVNNMGATMGYSQFPGGSSATDGVVIVHKYFGRMGTVVSPFNKGRTATHEVGHWLNLFHLWGTGSCGTDQVSDTPDQSGANFNCPIYPKYSTCGNRAAMMTMNFMDYTNDACMYMFSAGQRARMQAIFKPGGPRSSFVR